MTCVAERQHAHDNRQREAAQQRPYTLHVFHRVDRLRQQEVRSRLDLALQHAELPVQVRRVEVQRRADEERCRLFDLPSVRVNALVEPRHEPDQAGRRHVAHRGRVRVVTRERDVAHHREDVPQTQRMRAQQVRVQRQQVAMPDGHVHHRLDAQPRLHEASRGERAHPPLRTRTIRNVHGIDAPNYTAKLVQGPTHVEPARRRELHRNDELALLDTLRQPGGPDRRSLDALRSCRRRSRRAPRRRLQHAAHRVPDCCYVLGRCPTASADRRRSSTRDLPCRLSEVLRRRGVLEPTAHVSGESRVRLNDERRARQPSHAFDDAQQQVRAYAAVRAEREQLRIVERRDNVLRRIPARREAVAREGHLSDDRQFGNGAHCLYSELELRQ